MKTYTLTLSEPFYEYERVPMICSAYVKRILKTTPDEIIIKISDEPQPGFYHAKWNGDLNCIVGIFSQSSGMIYYDHGILGPLACFLEEHKLYDFYFEISLPDVQLKNPEPMKISLP